MSTITSLKTRTSLLAVRAFALAAAFVPASAGDWARVNPYDNIEDSVALIDAVNRDHPVFSYPYEAIRARNPVGRVNPFDNMEYSTDVADLANRIGSSGQDRVAYAPVAPTAPQVSVQPQRIDPYSTLESVDLVDAIDRAYGSSDGSYTG